jgi:hypothetical protein
MRKLPKPLPDPIRQLFAFRLPLVDPAGFIVTPYSNMQVNVCPLIGGYVVGRSGEKIVDNLTKSRITAERTS